MGHRKLRIYMRREKRVWNEADFESITQALIRLPCAYDFNEIVSERRAIKPSKVGSGERNQDMNGIVGFIVVIRGLLAPGSMPYSLYNGPAPYCTQLYIIRSNNRTFDITPFASR